jgi:predicted histidine transporter YuiF (NhaC family)
MPFRRYFEQRGAHHPVAYSMAVLALGMIVCMTIAVAISVQASNRAIEQGLAREREIQRETLVARQLQSERTRAIVCTVITAQAAVYERTEPISEAGEEAAKAWRLLAGTFQCQER